LCTNIDRYKIFREGPKLKISEFGDFLKYVYIFHKKNLVGNLVKTVRKLTKIQIFQYNSSNYTLCDIKITNSGQFDDFKQYGQTQFRLFFLDLEYLFNIDLSLFEQFINQDYYDFEFTEYKLLDKIRVKPF
jgi:hypothetical protein